MSLNETPILKEELLSLFLSSRIVILHDFWSLDSFVVLKTVDIFKYVLPES